ncbi:MAG: VOC family protein [Vibrio sp.]
MFSHIMVGTNDMEASKAFYDATFAVFGYEPGNFDPLGRCFYTGNQGIFAITKPLNGEPATHGNGYTIGFAANSPEQIEEWHRVGLAHGGRACEDPPGLRQSPNGDLYLGYLLDPSGNKLCVVHRP